MTPPIDGLSIVEDKRLVGSKTAYRQGDRLLVSPAMLELMQNADADELQHLVANIPVVGLGPLLDLIEQPPPPQFW